MRAHRLVTLEGDQRRHRLADRAQLVGAAQFGQVDHEGTAHDIGAGALRLARDKAHSLTLKSPLRPVPWAAPFGVFARHAVSAFVDYVVDAVGRIGADIGHNSRHFYGKKPAHQRCAGFGLAIADTRA